MLLDFIDSTALHPIEAIGDKLFIVAQIHSAWGDFKATKCGMNILYELATQQRSSILVGGAIEKHVGRNSCLRQNCRLEGQK